MLLPQEEKYRTSPAVRPRRHVLASAPPRPRQLWRLGLRKCTNIALQSPIAGCRFRSNCLAAMRRRSDASGARKAKKRRIPAQDQSDLQQQLPLDILALLFSFISLRPRLLVISLVCHRWRDAARRCPSSLLDLGNWPRDESSPHLVDPSMTTNALSHLSVVTALAADELLNNTHLRTLVMPRACVKLCDPHKRAPHLTGALRRIWAPVFPTWHDVSRQRCQCIAELVSLNSATLTRLDLVLVHNLVLSTELYALRLTDLRLSGCLPSLIVKHSSQLTQLRVDFLNTDKEDTIPASTSFPLLEECHITNVLSLAHFHTLRSMMPALRCLHLGINVSEEGPFTVQVALATITASSPVLVGLELTQDTHSLPSEWATLPAHLGLCSKLISFAFTGSNVDPRQIPFSLWRRLTVLSVDSRSQFSDFRTFLNVHTLILVNLRSPWMRSVKLPHVRHLRVAGALEGLPDEKIADWRRVIRACPQLHTFGTSHGWVTRGFEWGELLLLAQKQHVERVYAPEQPPKNIARQLLWLQVCAYWLDDLSEHYGYVDH